MNTDQKALVAIISTKRSNNVAFMQKICEPYIVAWFVNDGEGDDYMRAGAERVFECGNNICQARNRALSIARSLDGGMPCIQISDDLKNIKRVWLNDEGKRVTEFIEVVQVVESLITQCRHYNANFAGVAVNNNPLNYTGVNVSTDKLVVNDFICLMPNAMPFDEDMALKEDYDYCVTELLMSRKIVRLNNILCDFPHRQNDGGANTYRNDITENAATLKLMRKWPKYIVPHKTRPGQVSLDYKAIQKRLSGAEPKNLFDL